MSINLRFPNITGVTEKEQLAQIKSYLYQLVQELNWVLTNMESGAASEPAGKQPAMEGLSEEVFNELKALLIQSSSTLNSYYEKINGKLEGYYLKQDEFSRYTEEVSQRFVNLAKVYLAKGDFEAYQKSVTKAFEDLAQVYASKGSLEEYQQQVSKMFTDLAETYVSNAVYIAKVQEMEQNIETLRQMIEDMQTTGGE